MRCASEVVAAVAYPAFVLGFGMVTVTVLLTVVLPRLFSMLQEMLPDLPLPTLILLKVSGFLHQYWLLVLIAVGGCRLRLALVSCARPRGAEAWDRSKLRAARDGLGLSRRGVEPVCPDAGHAGQKRRVAAAGA